MSPCFVLWLLVPFRAILLVEWRQCTNFAAALPIWVIFLLIININHMRKILLLAALLLTVAQLWAADVDALTAQNTAQRFLLGQAGSGQFKAVAANLKLAHVQRSAKAGGAPV